MLDKILSKGLVGGVIKFYLVDFYYYLEVKMFEKVIKNIVSYDDKLCFFVFYSFLVKLFDFDELVEWMWVVYNLIENIIINILDEFCRGFFSLENFVKVK